jgi:hypothetical protein
MLQQPKWSLETASKRVNNKALTSCRPNFTPPHRTGREMSGGVGKEMKNVNKRPGLV